MGLNANGTHCCVETSGGQRCPLSSVLCPAAMKSSASMDSSDNKKTRHKLKKFLTRRPTLQAVRDKGYIKGAGTAPRRRHPATSPSSDPPSCVCLLQIRCSAAACPTCVTGRAPRCPPS